MGVEIKYHWRFFDKSGNVVAEGMSPPPPVKTMKAIFILMMTACMKTKRPAS